MVCMKIVYVGFAKKKSPAGGACAHQLGLVLGCSFCLDPPCVEIIRDDGSEVIALFVVDEQDPELDHIYVITESSGTTLDIDQLTLSLVVGGVNDQERILKSALQFPFRNMTILSVYEA